MSRGSATPDHVDYAFDTFFESASNDLGRFLGPGLKPSSSHPGRQARLPHCAEGACKRQFSRGSAAAFAFEKYRHKIILGPDACARRGPRASMHRSRRPLRSELGGFYVYPDGGDPGLSARL